MSRERQNGSEVASSSSQAKSRQNPESPGAASPPSSPASNSTTADSQHPLTASVSHTEGNPKKILLRRILDFLCGPSDPAGAPGTPRYTLKYRVPELVRSVDEYAPGYGKAAAFEDCDPGFLIYRKFAWLHNRVLLHAQDELQELEGTLESLDTWEASEGDRRKLAHRRIDENKSGSPRKDLLIKIKEKLAEYDETLFRMQKKQAIRKPTKRNQNSVYNLITTSKSIGSSESVWIRQWDDLAALAHDTECGWFSGFIEDTLRVISPKITLAIFRTKEQSIKTGSHPSLTLVSPERIDIFLRVILTIIAVLLLLLPVLILFELQPNETSQIRHNSRYQIITISLATLIFSASCSIFTKARRQEVFGATAAYCAVLVVFLGNSSNVVVVSSKG